MFCWNRSACVDVEPAMKPRFAWGAAGLVGLVAVVAGCASATGTRPDLSAPPASFAISPLAPTPSAVPTAETCGSVETNDFSAATVLYQADTDAVPCLVRAMTTCRPASLYITQTGVDSGADYRLTITGSATNGCKGRLHVNSFALGAFPSPTPTTAECMTRMQDTDVLIDCPDGTYLLPASVASQRVGQIDNPPGRP